MRQTFFTFTLMFSSVIYKVLISLLFLAFPALVLGKGKIAENPERELLALMKNEEVSWGPDSVPKVKKPSEKQQDGKKPEIKEVPKSRRQLKPGTVKDRIKTKPVKVPKPKVIKKAVGRTLKLIR